METTIQNQVVQTTRFVGSVATSYQQTYPKFTKQRVLSLGPKQFFDETWMMFKPFSCDVRSWTVTSGFVKTDSYGIIQQTPRRWGWKPYEVMDWHVPWTGGIVNGYNIDYNYRQTTLGKSLHNKAVAAFNDELINSPIDVAVFFGELNETVKMYVQTLDRIGRAFVAVRRKQFVKAGKILGSGRPKGVSASKALADNWLLYRYGVLPHLSDIEGLTQACLGEAVSSKFVYVRKYAKQPVDFSQRETLPNNVGRQCAPVSVPCTRTHTLKGEHKIVFGCLVEITNPTIAKLGQYGLINPLATGWELFPGSFILDWAFNIGDILQELHAWAGKRMVSGYKSESIKGTCRVVLDAKPGSVVGTSSYRTNIVTTPSCVVKLKWVNRTVLSSPPSLAISVSNGLNLKRILDATTLLHDRIVGRKR